MRKRLIPFLPAAAVILLSTVCCAHKGDGWTDGERSLINSDRQVMRVLTVEDPADSLILRQACIWLNENELRSSEYRRLADKLIATVTSPEQDGVGIAGPQVGISRRIIAVQRFDKPGEPFEVYPNIAIISTAGEKVSGPEGCLSVPGYRGMVARYRDITVKYTNVETLCDTTERIEGFTAVIFQHETDHLAGILYTDKADSISER